FRILSDSDPPNEDWQSALANSGSTVVVMTYGQWIKFLSDHKVNQSRLFCFPEVSCFLYPILRYSPRHDDPNKRNKYDLNYVSVLYLNDLTRYIELPRRKGIVVQNSFASVQSLLDAVGFDD